VRDSATEQRLLTQKFRKARFTAKQREELDRATMFELDNCTSTAGTPQALGDFVYYGTLTGDHGTVDGFLPSLTLSLHEQMGDLRERIYEESRSNVVTGTVAMPPQDGIKPPRREGMEHVAQQGETLASVAQRYDVTVKSLMNNNPGLTPQHLRVGRRLSIYLKQEIQFR